VLGIGGRPVVYPPVQRIVLRDRGATQITIISPPFAHWPELSHLIFLALHNRGYRATPHSLNQSIRLDERPFGARVDADGRRRLTRARELGFEARRLTSVPELSDAYELILDNTCRKGYKLSMTWDRVREMTEIFGDRIYGFGVFRETQPANYISVGAIPVCDSVRAASRDWAIGR